MFVRWLHHHIIFSWLMLTTLARSVSKHTSTTSTSDVHTSVFASKCILRSALLVITQLSWATAVWDFPQSVPHPTLLPGRWRWRPSRRPSQETVDDCQSAALGRTPSSFKLNSFSELSQTNKLRSSDVFLWLLMLFGWKLPVCDA